MNRSDEITPVGRLLLARLLVGGEKGATVGELKKALEPLLGHRLAGAALAEELARTLTGLQSAGLIVRTRKGKTERGTLTETGRGHALEFLGLDQLPPKTTWGQLTKSSLAARALGLPTPREKTAKLFSGDPGFKAALLRSQYELPLDDYPSFDQALDALAWSLLGFAPEPGTKFNLKTVKAALIHRALEGDASTQVDPKGDPKKEATKLLAKKVGARQTGKDELRLAAIRRWLDSEPASVPPPPTPPPPALDLDAFARRVLEAARASHTGWFGDNKVFIVHVFRALCTQPEFAAMGLDGFKRRLAEANNARLLDLSRADMVEAMDREDVELSRVSFVGSEFHFIRV